jgi:hypothetical protein
VDETGAVGARDPFAFGSLFIHSKNLLRSIFLGFLCLHFAIIYLLLFIFIFIFIFIFFIYFWSDEGIGPTIHAPDAEMDDSDDDTSKQNVNGNEASEDDENDADTNGENASDSLLVDDLDPDEIEDDEEENTDDDEDDDEAMEIEASNSSIEHPSSNNNTNQATSQRRLQCDASNRGNVELTNMTTVKKLMKSHFGFTAFKEGKSSLSLHPIVQCVACIFPFFFFALRIGEQQRQQAFQISI